MQRLDEPNHTNPYGGELQISTHACNTNDDKYIRVKSKQHGLPIWLRPAEISLYGGSAAALANPLPNSRIVARSKTVGRSDDDWMRYRHS